MLEIHALFGSKLRLSAGPSMSQFRSRKQTSPTASSTALVLRNYFTPSRSHAD
jgi:hypothetical protein